MTFFETSCEVLRVTCDSGAGRGGVAQRQSTGPQRRVLQARTRGRPVYRHVAPLQNLSSQGHATHQVGFSVHRWLVGQCVPGTSLLTQLLFCSYIVSLHLFRRIQTEAVTCVSMQGGAHDPGGGRGLH